MIWVDCLLLDLIWLGLLFRVVFAIGCCCFACFFVVW